MLVIGNARYKPCRYYEYEDYLRWIGSMSKFGKQEKELFQAYKKLSHSFPKKTGVCAWASWRDESPQHLQAEFGIGASWVSFSESWLKVFTQRPGSWSVGSKTGHWWVFTKTLTWVLLYPMSIYFSLPNNSETLNFSKENLIYVICPDYQLSMVLES